MRELLPGAVRDNTALALTAGVGGYGLAPWPGGQQVIDHG